jgi:hypothetical protein
MKKPTPQEALANLYQASQLAALPAEQHRLLAECASVINDIISPKKVEDKKE